MSKSLCSNCLKEVPASIYMQDHVYILKSCESCGETIGIIEKDIEFYNMVQSLNSEIIYPGIFIDVTGDCNLDCKYCYHEKSGGHKSLLSILETAYNYKQYAPFFLSGGEPTLHPYCIDIIQSLQKIGGVGVVSNGIATQDYHYCETISRHLDYGNGVVALGLSYHSEAPDATPRTLDNLGKIGKKASSVLFVIDSIEEIDDCVKFTKAYHRQIDHIRIKAGTSLWNEARNSNIYVSDMYKWLDGCTIDKSKNNKTSFVNVKYQDIDIMLVSWYNRNNIHLEDIDCPPYYIAKDGKLDNLVTACVRNEGL